MRAFVEIEIADVCYPHEAASWVAFGRLPEFHRFEDGTESRGASRAIGEGYAPRTRNLIKEDEVSAFFDEQMEIDAYFHAKIIDPGVDTVDEYFNSWLASEPDEWPYRQGPRPERGYRLAVLVQETDREVHRAWERARLKVLVKLMEGRVLATGLRLTDALLENDKWDSSEWDEIDAIEASVVPAEEWTEDSKPWSADPPQIRVGRYLYPVIQVEDLLREFPIPEIKEEPFSAIRRGGTIILKEENSNALSATKPRRGRYQIADGLISRAVVKEFQKRFDDGLAPRKAEALVHEAIEWVEGLYERRVSRSTMQRYLRPVLDALRDARK